MSWFADVSVWVEKPEIIQAFGDNGEEQDYVPERTCKNEYGWCSECEHFLHDGFKWCPNCGAKVVGE